MYVYDDELMHAAINIIRTRDDQLMHAGKTKKQIVTDRMNRNQNSYGLKKANAYKTEYNQAKYAEKYADPNDPWVKENTWKEERRNNIMSRDTRKKQTYNKPAGPGIVTNNNEKEQYFQYIANDAINNIPGHIDKLLRDRASSDPNFLNDLYYKGGKSYIKRGTSDNSAESNLMYAYLDKIEQSINGQLTKRYKYTIKIRPDQKDEILNKIREKYGFN